MSYTSKDIRRWTEYLVHCHRFIRGNPTKELLVDNRLKIREDWLEHMPTDLSTEEDEYNSEGDLGLSGTDILYCLLSYLECAHSIHVRNMYIEDSILDVIVDITLMACRHDPVTQKKPMNIDQVNQLFNRAASFVCRYGCIPVETLNQAISFKYPSEDKENAYRNLIELPHFKKWAKEKKERKPDTYKELEEIELIEKLKKIELENKNYIQKMNQDIDEGKFKHIFHVDDEDHQPLNDTDSEDSDESDDALYTDSDLLKRATQVNSTTTTSSSSSSSSSEVNYDNNEIRKRIEKKIRKRIKKSPMAKPDTVVPGINRGELWLVHRDLITSKFIQIFNHTFYGAYMECKVLQNCILANHNFDCNTSEYRERFYTWLHEHCEIDTNDDFIPRFRSMTQERMLPMGIRSRRFRREATASNWEQGMELMQDYLGMQCSTILHDVIYGKKVDICKDKNHPCFESLCITMFGYMVEHSSRDKSMKFNRKLYIQPTDIDADTIKWLTQPRLYGYPRPPVIVEVLNRYFINLSVFNDSKGNFEIVMYECQDMIHAILSWVFYLHQNHGSQLRFEIPVDMSHWYNQFFVPPKPPMSLNDMFKN